VVGKDLKEAASVVGVVEADDFLMVMFVWEAEVVIFQQVETETGPVGELDQQEGRTECSQPLVSEAQRDALARACFGCLGQEVEVCTGEGGVWRN
jgi:hypothetical protein